MATEEMVMHDSNTTEVLSMLPPYEGKWVLKLGAVIGSFTEELAKQAAKVVVLDFFRSGINKDENINGHHRNVKFVHLSYLSVSLNSIDLIFSNLLLMHLSDEEGIHTVQRMLKWLKPEGHTLFIESCFIPSMDCKPGFYMKVFKECRMHDELGNSYELSLAGGKCIGAYRKSKKNDNQVCWLWQKIESKDTTKEFLSKLDLKPGQKVLDVGCGIGGGNFYMAETFGVEVIGIDLSTNMISLALERAVGLKLPVEFEVADCTKKVYPDNTFDVIYSRDTILHIQDKPALFRTFYKWLKPGGKVLISDYCKSAGEPSPEFAEYIKQRGYDLHDVKTYGQMLRDAGFDEVIAEDRTDQFIQVLQKELESTEKGKDRFISDFSKEDYDDIVNGWKAKLVRSTCGQQLWGLFLAKKHCRDASH